MAKKSSSARWMHEHVTDEYVKKAQQEGYRSRAVYKLFEINEKVNFIKPGASVLDLGAAPGGWSQIAKKITGDNSLIIASDILEIDPIDGVKFIQGDFTEDEVYEEIISSTKNQQFDVVLSDMAPNFSGQPSVDLPRAMNLCDLALDMATKVLNKKGYFFVKVFQGPGFDDFIANCRNHFSSVSIKKPKASRARSKEVYLLANQLK
jgi:23S rRNA (uridine2552-2'-O)-methyltransferase